MAKKRKKRTWQDRIILRHLEQYSQVKRWLNAGITNCVANASKQWRRSNMSIFLTNSFCNYPNSLWTKLAICAAQRNSAILSKYSYKQPLGIMEILLKVSKPWGRVFMQKKRNLDFSFLNVVCIFLRDKAIWISPSMLYLPSIMHEICNFLLMVIFIFP